MPPGWQAFGARRAWTDEQCERSERVEEGRRDVRACRTRRAERADVVRSAHVVEVDDEDEGLAGGDGGAGTALAVGEVRRDGQLAPAAHLHPLDPLVPAGDDHADTQAEVERVAPVPGGVELLTRRVRDADVVGADRVTGLGLAALALDEVLDDEVGGRVALWEVDLRLRAVRVQCHAADAFRRWVRWTVSRRRGCRRRRPACRCRRSWAGCPSRRSRPWAGSPAARGSRPSCPPGWSPNRG